jgi:hypothetical protein
MCVAIASFAAGPDAGAAGTSSSRLALRLDAAGGLEPLLIQPAPLPPRLVADLHLGESTEGAVLRLIEEGQAATGRYRAWVQFQSSLSISNEGPHLDLLHWKHCTSDWGRLAEISATTFLVPHAPEDLGSCLESAGVGEIRRAVRAEARIHGLPISDQKWVSLLDDVQRAGDAPTYVAPSALRLRVERLDAGEWVEVTTVEVRIPMGC